MQECFDMFFQKIPKQHSRVENAYHGKELQERLDEYETVGKLHIEDRLSKTLSAIPNKQIKSVTI